MDRAALTEEVLELGPASSIVGVLTRPPARGAPPFTESGVAVIIPNAGIIHRSGPNRIHVRLARMLAAVGIPSLRLDLPGIGDSATLGGGMSMTEEKLAAMRFALDRLESMDVARRFIALGLCSGASSSFQIACVDPRIKGVVLIDSPTVFPTWQHRILRTVMTVSRPVVWWRLMTGHYRRAQREQRGMAGRSWAEDDATPQPGAREIATRALTILVQRDVRLLVIFTDHRNGNYSYRRQFFDAFPGLGLERTTRVVRFAGADHTFGKEKDRLRLEHEILDWFATSGLRVNGRRAATEPAASTH